MFDTWQTCTDTGIFLQNAFEKATPFSISCYFCKMDHFTWMYLNKTRQTGLNRQLNSYAFHRLQYFSVQAKLDLAPVQLAAMFACAGLVTISIFHPCLPWQPIIKWLYLVTWCNHYLTKLNMNRRACGGRTLKGCSCQKATKLKNMHSYLRMFDLAAQLIRFIFVPEFIV